MTDKTDIGALRRRSNNLRTADQTDAFIDLLLDKLEAEHQQREAAEKERDDLLNQEFQQRLANAEHQLEMKDLAIRNVKASRMAQFRKRKAAEAELAELRGEQEPVAWLNDAYLSRGVVDGEAGKDDAGPGYVPVYRERQPKPVVVLPKSHYVAGCADKFMSEREVQGAMLAAGIVVKDGE